MASIHPVSRSRRARIGDIAVVRGGFIPSAAEARDRKRQEEENRRQILKGDGGANLPRDLGLQPSAIQPDGSIDWSELVAQFPIRGGDRYAVHEGELLLPLRSQRILTVVARDVPAVVLAVGQWAMIAPDHARADPEYLAWYLNHPLTRARLAGTMVGTSLQFLTVGTVRDFEVDLPDLATQRRIGRFAALTARVGQLERRLATVRQQFFDGLFMDSVIGARDLDATNEAEHILRNNR